MRGYFAIGIEGVSKPGNMGNLMRTAHGFGAAFVFSIRSKLDADSRRSLKTIKTDTSKTADSIPYYEFDGADEMVLPEGCRLIGVEMTDQAVELPTFRHPLKAAYILGSERYSLSDALIKDCDHVIKIPTRFSLNVATAGAIVMYDRMIAFGRFANRPVTPSGDAEDMPPHVRGTPVIRRKGAS